MDLRKLRTLNVERCEAVFHPVDSWSPTDWACAVAGEVGEMCNLVKKLRRFADGTNTAKDPASEQDCVALIGLEIADAIIYLDLLAARLGTDLAVTVPAKFDVVSARMGYPVSLHEITSPSTTSSGAGEVIVSEAWLDILPEE